MMDVFKRFRARRKGSKGQTDSFVSFADAESSYRSSSSTWRNGDDSTPKRLRSNNVQRSKEPETLISSTPSVQDRRPGSSGRIQPTFLALPSSSTTVSRPGTASSMQNALNRAADSLSSPRDQNVPLSLSQSNGKPSRYIDIFAIAKRTDNSSTTYNEDVAERNLSFFPSPTKGEKQSLRKQSHSGHQEEALNRTPQQISVERAFSVRSGQSETTPSQAINPGLGLASSYAHYGRPNQESSSHHSRQYSSRTKEASQYLPPIPQERLSEEAVYDGRSMVEEAEREMEAARQRWLEAKRMNTFPSQPPREKPLPAYPTLGNVPNATISPYLNGNNNMQVSNLHQDYFVPTQGSSTPTQPPPHQQYRPAENYADSSAPSIDRDDRVGGPVRAVTAQQRLSDGSRRSQTQRTSSNYSMMRKVMVGNRTVMDLTEDDLELQSVMSYPETPIIQEATSDEVRKVKPEIIATQSQAKDVQGEATIPDKRLSSALEPVLDIGQLARRSQIHSQGVNVDDRPPVPVASLPEATRPATPPPHNFGFSGISTITSTSPRASRKVLPSDDSTNLPPERNESSVYNQVVDTGRPKDVRSHSVPKVKTRTAAKISPQVNILADVAPQDNENVHSSVVSDRTITARTILAKAQERLQQENIGLRREVAERGLSKSPAMQAAQKASASKAEPKPHVSEHHEVKTRDFAMTPVRKPSSERTRSSSKDSKRSEKRPTKAEKTIQEVIAGPQATSNNGSKSKPSRSGNGTNSGEKSSKSSTKGKKPAQQNSSATRRTRPLSVFDEEAFKRKQAVANAALLKLQQSLEETLPSAEVTADTTRPVHSRESNKSPVPEQRDTAASIAPTDTASPARVASPRAASQSLSRDVPLMGNGIISNIISNSTAPNEAIAHSRSNTNSRPIEIRRDIMALNPILAKVDGNNKPPPSPGEISLSSFPVPTPRATSPEVVNKPAFTTTTTQSTPLIRRGSQASRMSSASTFSIPFSMVPGRGSSLQAYGPPESQSIMTKIAG